MKTSSELVNALLDERYRIEDEIEKLEERLSHINGLLEQDNSNNIKVFQVNSETDADTTYTVEHNIDYNTYKCSCPDYTYRTKNGNDHQCKHINRVISRRGGYTLNM